MSLFIFLLFPVVTPPPPPPPPPPDEPKPVTVRLIPKEQPSKDPEILKGNKDSLSYPTDPHICSSKDKSYRGVGIIYSYGSNMIVHAPEYYPAYKAGLRLGDFIVNETTEVNGYIDFDVRRGYTKLFFHIKLDNICYNDE
jgi:predicted metalloprotease with PDZ domain